MTYKITEFHTLQIKTTWFDWSSGNWSLEYTIQDSITKQEVKNTYCFDRWFASPLENPQFICDKFCERTKEIYLLKK